MIYFWSQASCLSYWAFKWASLSSKSANSDRSDSNSVAVNSTWTSKQCGDSKRQKFQTCQFAGDEKVSTNLFLAIRAWNPGQPTQTKHIQHDCSTFQLSSSPRMAMQLRPMLDQSKKTKQKSIQSFLILVSIIYLFFFPFFFSFRIEIPQTTISTWLWSRWSINLRRVLTRSWDFKVIWNNLYLTKITFHEAIFNGRKKSRPMTWKK